MRHLSALLLLVLTATLAQAQVVTRDIPYANPAHERQVLDVYAPPGAKGPAGRVLDPRRRLADRRQGTVALKPQAFNDKGFVFVSTNYRLLPSVEMGDIVRDVAKALRWVHDHVAEYGGDPDTVLRHGPLGRWAARRPGLHRRPLPEGRGAVARR